MEDHQPHPPRKINSGKLIDHEKWLQGLDGAPIGEIIFTGKYCKIFSRTIGPEQKSNTHGYFVILYKIIVRIIGARNMVGSQHEKLFLHVFNIG
jgi:hypothetical protein